jgi:undecaprenyl diphosphate synthase
MPLIRLDCLPRHVAIIMDGNGRWAHQTGRPRTAGHREGSNAVRRTVRTCRRLGIDTLTLFAFSEQNWERPAYEVHALMDLFREFLIKERPEVLRTGIRVRPLGRVQRLPLYVRSLLRQLESETGHLDGMTLQLAISYGGQEEIADAARRLAEKAKSGEIDPSSIDEKSLAAELPSSEAGPVDLLIRTGGECRISNFLLWGCAYAEFYFTRTLWPAFGEEDLFQAISSFQNRNRRFGRVVTEEHSREPVLAQSSVTPAHV